MHPIVIHHSFFGARGQGLDRRHSQKGVLWLMETMIRLNELVLNQFPDTPLLYESGVVYEREDDKEDWQDILHIIASGSGDCEDLACWRAAQLRRMGVRAGPYITWRKTPRGMIYHALVRLPSGKIEDPSLALGMRGGEMLVPPVYVDP